MSENVSECVGRAMMDYGQPAVDGLCPFGDPAVDGPCPFGDPPPLMDHVRLAIAEEI
jgi:hypothetical protein